MENEFFKENTLNIFTDASIYKTKEGITIGCPGFCAVETIQNLPNKTDTKIIGNSYKILSDSTNNESEMYAILEGIRFAISNYNNYDKINLFSDSQISIFGLREWIFNWNTNNKFIYNSQGSQIKNQGIIMEIIHTICNNNLNINLYHQKGHVSLLSVESVENARKVFKQSNNVILNTFEVCKLSYYNDVIDNYTRRRLSKYTEDNVLNVKNNAITFKPSFDLEKYKTLINANKRGECNAKFI